MPDETPEQTQGRPSGGARPDDGASSSDGPNATFRAALAAVGRFLTHRQMVLFALGLAVGAIAALAAIGFREGIALVQTARARLRRGARGDRDPRHAVVARDAGPGGGRARGRADHPLRPARAPPPGRRRRDGGDRACKGARMGLGTGLAAAAASIVALGAGASVGREGPVVHLGASLSSWLAQKLNLSRPLAVTLLGCGVASAIAASFNTPIAGVFFALEVVVGHYALSSFAPVVIASVTGTIVTRPITATSRRSRSRRARSSRSWSSRPSRCWASPARSSPSPSSAPPRRSRTWPTAPRCRNGAARRSPASWSARSASGSRRCWASATTPPTPPWPSASRSRRSSSCWSSS